MSSPFSQTGLPIHLLVCLSLDEPFSPEQVILKDLSALLSAFAPH